MMQRGDAVARRRGRCLLPFSVALPVNADCPGVTAMALFRDRQDAGRRLAEKLRGYAGTNAIVLALPRGGVPVAAEVAARLGLPLDVYIVRKLGVPGQAELAMGAIASGGVRVMNDDVVHGLGIPEHVVDSVAQAEGAELARREAAYRTARPPLEVAERTVILIDDGLATGATMRAAVQALRVRHAARIVVAVPVGAPETCQMLAAEADEIVCAVAPEPFLAVGYWYEDFAQTTDEEVQAILSSTSPEPRVA
jgi:putative phosphoribosyl transferase